MAGGAYFVLCRCSSVWGVVLCMREGGRVYIAFSPPGGAMFLLSGYRLKKKIIVLMVSAWR